jgi:hypothetical protein
LSRAGTIGAGIAFPEFEHGKYRVRDFTMQSARPAFAPHPGGFGRGPARVLEPQCPCADWSISSDLKLFATTFAAGFLFVSIIIG